MTFGRNIRLAVAAVVAGGVAFSAASAWAVEWLEALPMIGKGQAEGVTSSAPVEAAPQGPRSSKQVIVRVLDKQTNRVQQLNLTAGKVVTVGSLSVGMQTCLFDYKRTPKLDVAWLDVVDETLPDRTYSGWMYSLYPAAATLEHPRYDVRVMACVLPDGASRMVPTSNVSLTTPVATDSAGGGDDEAPAPEVPDQGDQDTDAAPAPVVEKVEETSPAAMVEPNTPAVVRPAGQDDPYFVPGLDDAGVAQGDKAGQEQMSPEPMTGGIDQVIDRHELQRMMDTGAQ